MAALNYATQYSQALAQAYPYVLNFGALYATPNNGRYRMGADGKTVKIPSISTTGRVNSNRDTVATAQRNYDNSWETKELTNGRKWSTLVHPADIDQTNGVTTIQNITQVYNEEQKFPEMDAYCVSRLYSAWTGQGKTPISGSDISSLNVLSLFDTMMKNMTNARVNPNGRILYITPDVEAMIKTAQQIQRTFDVKSVGSRVDRTITSLDTVEVVVVPPVLMKTVYNFTIGWEPAEGAAQIDMFLVHPSAVITPISYSFSQLDEPSAGSEGKYIYFEESHEDVFILNKRADALQFVVSPAGTPTVTMVSVSPATASVGKGDTESFSATVAGTNSPSQSVTWSVTGGISGTSISPSGVLTVAAGETASTLTVTATSVFDDSKSGSATVTVTE